MYLADFLMQFLVEYYPKDTYESSKSIRNAELTAQRYIKNEMMFDMVPLFPFTLMFKHKYSRLYFLIKCIRIKKCYQLLDTKKFNKVVKNWLNIKLKQACNDPLKANDMMVDHT